MLGSFKKEVIERRTFPIVKTGLHCLFNISKHIPPFSFTFGWNIFVVNLHNGGFNGYSFGNFISKLNIPPYYGEFIGPVIVAFQWYKSLLLIKEALQPSNGCFLRSSNSLLILFSILIL